MARSRLMIVEYDLKIFCEIQCLGYSVNFIYLLYLYMCLFDRLETSVIEFYFFTLDSDIFALRIMAQHGVVPLTTSSPHPGVMGTWH